MKRVVACYTNCFGAGGLRAAALRVRETGLNALEVALRGHTMGGLVVPESSVLTERSGEGEARAVIDLFREQGVTVSGCNVGGADVLTDEGRDVVIRRIRLARRWFGVAVVVSGAGQPADEAARAVMVGNLRRIGDAAGEVGVTVALETHQGPTQNADAMLALMADVDHPHVRLNFDTGNIAYYNRGADPVAELDRVKHLVRSVHLKDNRGGFEDWYFPALGAGGAVDFTRVREVLDGAGFLGPYSVEIEGIRGEPEPGPDARVERVAASARHLAACGYFGEAPGASDQQRGLDDEPRPEPQRHARPGGAAGGEAVENEQERR